MSTAMSLIAIKMVEMNTKQLYMDLTIFASFVICAGKKPFTESLLDPIRKELRII